MPKSPLKLKRFKMAQNKWRKWYEKIVEKMASPIPVAAEKGTSPYQA